MEKGEERFALLRKELDGGLGLVRRSWEESKKLWRIVWPAVFSGIATFSTIVITQAFAGHLGDLELAAVSVTIAAIIGFNFGLMLGMASALETLSGQAFGAKQYHMLGIYMQRSWIVIVLCGLIFLPTFFFATPIFILIGQPPELAALAGQVAIWMIPLHFAFAFLFPLQRFLQSQLKNTIIAYVSGVALLLHVFISWLCVSKLQLGLFGAVATLDFSWWVVVVGLFIYVRCGGCPHSWHGFSMEAFSGLWEFFKLSAASGVMICLEFWYYRILILVTGNLKNAETAVDALSICLGINEWELMIPLGFFAATGVRVANELGAGNGKGARFASIVSVVSSLAIGLLFCIVIVVLHDKFGLIFTSSTAVLKVVDKIYFLLVFTILLNSIQQVLSGVAVGSGWQALVAYVNIGCYYLIGIPVGILLGWVFHLGVAGFWGGLIIGTAVQTLIVAIVTIRCDWDKEAMKASFAEN